jgi:hypothetical protein
MAKMRFWSLRKWHTKEMMCKRYLSVSTFDVSSTDLSSVLAIQKVIQDFLFWLALAIRDQFSEVFCVKKLQKTHPSPTPLRSSHHARSCNVWLDL